MSRFAIETELITRRAQPEDALKIISLYHEIYEGTYPDPTMSDISALEATLASKDYCWMVAAYGQKIVGSVVYQVDALNRLAKVYGAVIAPGFRGLNLTESLMNCGHDLLNKSINPVDVIYATTRTVTPAPQKLTANLGYRKLGIFPNVHQTDDYETHCLAGLFSKTAFELRFKDFKLHPKICNLFEIARRECELPALEIAETPPHAPALSERIDLETIEAANFVKHRFHRERPTTKNHHWFFPFHEPNLLLTTPDHSVEVFAYYSSADRHCVIIAISDVENIGYVDILANACRILRRKGARYIEFIMRADETNNIETAIQSQFLPCAYFPALQLSEGMRFDYVIFSRSFEILNFANLKLEGVNRQYLVQYYKSWKEISLDPIQLQD